VNFERLRKSACTKRVLHAAREAARERVQVTGESIEKAIGTFESVCVAEGIKYRIKREEREDPSA